MIHDPDQAISAMRRIIDKYRDNVNALEIRIATGETSYEHREVDMDLLRQEALDKITEILNR